MNMAENRSPIIIYEVVRRLREMKLAFESFQQAYLKIGVSSQNYIDSMIYSFNAIPSALPNIQSSLLEMPDNMISVTKLTGRDRYQIYLAELALSEVDEKVAAKVYRHQNNCLLAINIGDWSTVNAYLDIGFDPIMIATQLIKDHPNESYGTMNKLIAEFPETLSAENRDGTTIFDLLTEICFGESVLND